MKKVLFYILCIFAITKGSPLQASSQDSLFALFENKSTTIELRLKALSSYIHKYKIIGTDSTLALANKGLEMAKDNSNYKYQLIFTRKKAEIYNYQLQDFDQAKDFYLKTLKLCDKVEGSTSRPGLYKGLADMHMYQNKMVEAKGFYEDAVKFAKELEEPKRSLELGAVYVSYGNYYNNCNQFKEAIKVCRKAQILFEKIDNPNASIAIGNIGSFYNRLGLFDSALLSYRSIPLDPNDLNSQAINNYNIGMIFQNMEYHDSCLFYYTEAYKFFKQNGNKRGESASLHGLGLEYSVAGNQKKAIELFKKAIEICKETNNKKSLYNNYRLIGQSFLKLKDYENTNLYFSLAAELGQSELENPTTTADIFADFGSLFLAEDKIDIALSNFDSALHYFTLSKEEKMIAVSRNKIAECKLKLNLPKEALTVLYTNLPYVINTKNETLTITYDLMSQAYFNMKNLDSAFAYLTLHNNIIDSIDARTNKEIESRIRNEFAVELNEKDKELALAQANKERTLKYFGFGLFGLTILSLIFIVYKHRKFKKEKEISTKLKIEAAEKSIKHSKEILQNQSYLILEKNRIINELKENIQAHFGEDLVASEHFDNLLEHKILTAEDWSNFKKSFSVLYPDFISKVNSKFQNLTETELRILCLKRLGLTREEMAEMVGVLPESIKKAVNRFKSKHNILDSLEELLKKIV